MRTCVDVSSLLNRVSLFPPLAHDVLGVQQIRPAEFCGWGPPFWVSSAGVTIFPVSVLFLTGIAKQWWSPAVFVLCGLSSGVAIHSRCFFGVLSPCRFGSSVAGLFPHRTHRGFSFLQPMAMLFSASPMTVFSGPFYGGVLLRGSKQAVWRSPVVKILSPELSCFEGMLIFSFFLCVATCRCWISRFWGEDGGSLGLRFLRCPDWNYDDVL